MQGTKEEWGGLHSKYRLLRPLTSLVCNDTMQVSFSILSLNARNRRSRFLAFKLKIEILTCIGIAKQGKKAIGNPTISGQKTNNLLVHM
jgi:hypothetical protein